MLITTQELLHGINRPDIIIFDCRFALPGTAFDPTEGKRKYDQGHIPGAFYIDLEHDLSGRQTSHSGRHPLPGAKQFLDRMQKYGVEPAKQVIAYDDTANVFAARLWWMLRYWLGHARISLLDGGFDAWSAEHLAVTSDVTTPTSTQYRYQTNPTYIKSTPDIQTLLQRAGVEILVDARAHDRFTGEAENVDPVAGHIPGAINVPCMGNVNQQKKFLPVNQLRARFADIVATAGETARIAHYCGSGVTACHNIFAMELAGFSGTRLYPGSWSEWIHDNNNPVAVGE